MACCALVIRRRSDHQANHPITTADSATAATRMTTAFNTALRSPAIASSTNRNRTTTMGS